MNNPEELNLWVILSVPIWLPSYSHKVCCIGTESVEECCLAQKGLKSVVWHRKWCKMKVLIIVLIIVIGKTTLKYVWNVCFTLYVFHFIFLRLYFFLISAMFKQWLLTFFKISNKNWIPFFCVHKLIKLILWVNSL